jgi:Transposase DNA-binding
MYQPSKDDDWINENFANADFNDERLRDRLMTIVKGMSKRPDGSIPQQMENWGDIKACYNFLRNDKVTHKRIQTPHRKRVRGIASDKINGEVVLFVQDTSELDFSNLENTEGLGFIGNHNNMGIMFHNCLAIEPNETNPKVIGLANQQVWTRKELSKIRNETRTQGYKREKESDVWLKNLRAIGSPPKGCTWVSVGDRANDVFKFFVKSREMGWESIVRACQDRSVIIDNTEKTLMTHMRSMESMGTTIVNVRKNGDTLKREIILDLCWEKVTIYPPAYLRTKLDPIELSVIRCWNSDEELEWIIYSSIGVNSLEEAIEKVKWYAHRWIIEEYHKCLKTGCRIEASQLESGKGLEKLLGVLGIIAILLLQLRNAARENPDSPASEVVDEQALKIISKRFKLPMDMSIGIFWRSVAKLGGFLGRKSDGQPGWQTLWKGWMRFQDMLWGHSCFEYG